MRTAKSKISIYLKGELHLKENEFCTICIEFDQVGNIKNTEIAGEIRDFTEERNIFIENHPPS